MTLADWVPALTTSGLVTIGLTIAGVVLKQVLEAGIKAEFERDLEAVRSEFRKDEDRLRAELNARDARLDALRSNALAGLSSRRTALESRQLAAAERLWAAVVERSDQKIAATMAKTLRLEVMIERASKNTADAQKLRDMAEFLWTSFNLGKVPNHAEIAKERPFLSPIVWALYTAYSLVLAYPIIQLMLIRTGSEASLLKDPAEAVAMVKAALPERSQYLDEVGVVGLSYLVDELEAKLLAALMASLEGQEADERAVRQAAEILRHAEQVHAEQAQAQTDRPLQVMGGVPIGS